MIDVHHFDWIIARFIYQLNYQPQAFSMEQKNIKFNRTELLKFTCVCLLFAINAFVQHEYHLIYVTSDATRFFLLSRKFLCDSPYNLQFFRIFRLKFRLNSRSEKKNRLVFFRLHKIRFHWASNISAYINLCRFLLFYSFGILEMIYGDFFNLSVYSATYDHWFIIDTTHTEANNKNTVTLNISSLNY